VKAIFLRRRRKTLLLLAASYLLVGLVSWLAIRTLRVSATPALAAHGDEADIGGPPGAFHDSWRDDHSRTCRFDITWRTNDAEPDWRTVDVVVTNVSGVPLWYFERYRQLMCHPFVRSRRLGEDSWERAEDPLAPCCGSKGDSWRRIDDGAQVKVSTTWINDKSDVDVCFVVSFWQELKDGETPKRPIDACSPVVRIGG